MMMMMNATVTFSTIARGLTIGLGILSLVIIVMIAGFRLHFQRLRTSQLRSSKKKIAFFHPCCSSGGGGERVLWKAIQALDELHAVEGLSFEIVIYTVDKANEKYRKTLLDHVQSRFSIQPTTSVTVSFAHLDQYAHFFGTFHSEKCARPDCYTEKLVPFSNLEYFSHTYTYTYRQGHSLLSHCRVMGDYEICLPSSDSQHTRCIY
jgi:hypothetical protein